MRTLRIIIGSDIGQAPCYHEKANIIILGNVPHYSEEKSLKALVHEITHWAELAFLKRSQVNQVHSEYDNRKTLFLAGETTVRPFIERLADEMANTCKIGD